MIHPAVRELFLDLGKHPAFLEASRRLAAGGAASLSGLTSPAKAVYSVLLAQAVDNPLIIVVDGSKEAETLFEAVSTFFGLLASDESGGPQLLPSLDVLPLQRLSPHAEISEQRAVGLWRLAMRRSPITIVPIAAALQRIHPGDFYRQLALRLRVGEEVPFEEVVSHLESVSYERREPVEMVGEFSVRGGILDVFSPESPKPVRIDLFGDQVESIRRFDVESQRSVLKIEECTLLPLTEFPKSNELLVELGELARESGIPSRDLPPPGQPFPGWELLSAMVRPRNASIFEMVDHPIVLWDEPELIRGAAERFWKRLDQIERSAAYDPGKIYFQWEDLERQTSSNPRLALRELDLSGDINTAMHIATRPSMAFHGNMQVAIGEARTLVEAGNRVAFFASSTGEVERVADILNEYRVPYQLGLERFDSTPAYLAERAYLSGSVANVYLVKGTVPRGVAFPESRLVIFGSEDLFETSDLVARAPGSKSTLATFSADFVDLKPGDYVVHAEHGVAQYLGLREIAQGEAKGDYMLLEFAAGAKLYVPLTRMDLIQRFRGAGEGKPAARPHGRRHLDAHQKQRSKPKCATWRMSFSSSTPHARWPTASTIRPTATGSGNSRMRSNSTRPATSLLPYGRSRRTWKVPTHGPPALRRRRFRQDRGGHAGCL